MISVVSVWLKRLFFFFGALVFLCLLVNFVMANSQLIRFNLAGYHLPEIKASSVAVVSFVLGGTSGVMVSLVNISRLRLANASFKRKIKRRDAEIQKLRADSLKGLS